MASRSTQLAFRQYLTQYSRSGDPYQRNLNITRSLLGTVLICIMSLILQLVTLSSHDWGYYKVEAQGVSIESGRFGLWNVCVESIRGTIIHADCGTVQPEQFSLPGSSAFAGICGILSFTLILICGVMATVQLIQIRTAVSTVCTTRNSLTQKIVPVVFSLVSMSVCLIFAALAVKRVRSATVSHGWSFWVQAGAIGLVVLLLICTAVESIWRPYSVITPQREPPKTRSPIKQSFFLEKPDRLEGFPTRPSAAEIEALVSSKTNSRRIYRRSFSEGATANLTVDKVFP